jgi:hypothetical protein
MATNTPKKLTARVPSPASPGSRIVWINHFGGFNGPAKVRLLKIIEDEQTSYPFLVGARTAGQRKLGLYRWARVYPSRQSALAAMGGWEAARRKRIHCANSNFNQPSCDK